MAKKKAEKPAKFEKTWESKPIAFQVRGSVEYKAAIERIAETNGQSVAAFMDQAARHYAKMIGSTEQIPKR